MRRWAKRLAVSAIQSHEPRGPRTAVHGVELLGVGGGYGDGEPVGSALFQLPQRPANRRAPDPARARMHANQSRRACASALSWGSSSRPSRSAARTHNRYSHHALYAYVPWCSGALALSSIKIGLFI